MSDSTELYERWLEIPSDFCPPNHYVLLGVDEFTDDESAIDAAAKKRTAYLHQIAAGPNRKEIQQLLGEVAVARRTLLDASSRSEYDEWLSTPDEDDEDSTVSETSSSAITIRLSEEDLSPSRRPKPKKARDKEANSSRGRQRKNKSMWRRLQIPFGIRRVASHRGIGGTGLVIAVAGPLQPACQKRPVKTCWSEVQGLGGHPRHPR